MENCIKKEITEHGTVCYYNTKGLYHRIDGPAVEYASGAKEWFVNGKHHRIDGPASIFPKTNKYWALNDVYMCQEQHKILVLFSILETGRCCIEPNDE